MRPDSAFYGVLTIAVVGLFIACGGDPSPVKPSPPSLSPPASIEVLCPDSLDAGQSAQCLAKISLEDGTTKSATSMSNLGWRSSNPSRLSVSNSGLVTAGLSASGEATIMAVITPPGAVQGTHRVVIRPAFSLSVSPPNVTARSQLSVSWVAPSGRSSADWIAIFKAESGNEAWAGIWWSYTGGSTAGTFTMSAPAEPGAYEFRYFLDNGFELTAKSSLVNVTTDAPARQGTLLIAISATDLEIAARTR